MHHPRRALILPSLLVLVFGMNACGGKSDDDKISTKGSTSTTATGAPDQADDDSGGSIEAGGGPGSDGGGSGGSGGGSASGTGGGEGGPQSEAPPAPQAPNAAQPSKPGVYLYDVTGTMTQSGPLGGTEPVPTPQKLTVEAADGGRQRSSLDARDSNGDGSTRTTVLQYRDDGVYLESLKLQTKVGTISITYDFVPASPQLIAPTGAGVGYHTEFSMTSTNGGLKTTTTIDVLAEETATVGGAAVTTLKARTHTTVEGDANGETTTTANIDPSTYLSVGDHTVSDLDTSFGNIKSDSTSALRSLDPA